MSHDCAGNPTHAKRIQLGYGSTLIVEADDRKATNVLVTLGKAQLRRTVDPQCGQQVEPMKRLDLQISAGQYYKDEGVDERLDEGVDEWVDTWLDY